MSSRISSALALSAVVAACSPTETEKRRASPPRASTATQTPTPTPDAPVRIACAHGAAVLARVCVLEEGAGQDALTVRFPDGGFRRIVVTGDGRGVIAADGADPARVTLVAAGGGEAPTLEVRIGEDRFRLPVADTGSRR